LRVTVFDSYAVLALFFGEPGAQQVEDRLHEAAGANQPVLMTAMNWAEVLYQMRRKRGNEGVATAKLFEATMPFDVVPADRDLAEVAAEYKAAHKMSLADAFAAALAKQQKAELFTGDKEFKPLERELKKITWLK
jgi:ribonuclease VapC